MSTEDLVQACTRSGEPAAWEEFVHRFHQVIAGTVLRTVRHWELPSRQVVDDLVQETYLKLCRVDCRLLRGFTPEHPGAMYGFLKVVAANMVHDHFKGAHAEKRYAGQPPERLDCDALTAGAGSVSGDSSLFRQILLGQVARQLEQSFPGPEHARTRLIFWLYYRQGLTASSIAKLPGIELTTKGVESAILRITKELRWAMARMPPEPLREPIGRGFQPAKSF